MGYLIAQNKMDVESALGWLREKYETADPNLGFLIQLKQFSKDIAASGGQTDTRMEIESSV